MTRFIPWISALALLTGCAGRQAEFPSLAKRPIEGGMNEPVVGSALPAPIATPLDEANLAKAAAAVRTARDGESIFEAALGPAQRAVEKAKGAPFGTEAWIEAQMAVSALERTRLPVKTALSDIDDIEGTLISGNAAADLTKLVEASRVISSIDAEQARSVERLLTQLKSR